MIRMWTAALLLAVAALAGPGTRAGAMPATMSLAYGEEPRQAIDFYAAPEAAVSPPLVLFVHGGAWRLGDRSLVQSKPEFFTGLGYAFASAGYRLVPGATVEEQAQDVADAVALLRRTGPALGYDGDRIVLVGHSAGAHLAALIATDPRYLGEDFGAIAGAVLLDGAGYDVPRQMEESWRLLRWMYREAFGTDPERQRALSPLAHAGPPDAPAWLILHVERRRDSRGQSEALGEALEAAGARVEVVAIGDTSHALLNRRLGTESDPATNVVAEWLERLFGS